MLTKSLVSASLVAGALAASLPEAAMTPSRARALLQKRENCGPGIGSCANGECCSQYNWCGTTSDHCGNNCQPQYGTCGGGSSNEPGDETLSISRPKFGNIAYGPQIYGCNVAGTIAITFDDGPSKYTNQLLDILAQNGVKATFFVNGDNFDKIQDAPYPDIVRRMVADGHQIGSHTWKHVDLNLQTTASRRSQMAKIESFLKSTLGYFPTYMRPPFGNCDSACQSDMANLGYHVINWNIDTLDYDNDDPSKIGTSMGIFDNAVSGDSSRNSYISLEHDVHEQTVVSLASHIIQTAHSRGYRTVTVGECLGDPSGNWYRDGNGNPVGSGPGVSPDGRCGPNNGGFTCAGSVFGRCCSIFGYCGTSDFFCGGGCQSGYGQCGLIPSTDGTCGGSNGATCTGSKKGPCCSAWGYCGGSDLFCGGGCKGDWGSCGTALVPSTDGTCGSNSPGGKYTCTGSTFGRCCSAFGYCGGNSLFCDAGCQSPFGQCN